MFGLEGSWDGFIMMLCAIDTDPTIFWDTYCSYNAISYVNGLIKPTDVLDLMEQAKTAATQEEKAALCQEASSLYMSYAPLLPIVASTTTYSFTQDDVVDANFAIGAGYQWTPELVGFSD